MECNRLQKLIKSWYIRVQDESMAPARMVEFMHAHAEDCPVCMADPVIENEIKRITEIVLPPSKIPKAVRREEKKQEIAERALDADQDDPDDDVDDTEEDEDDDLDPDDDDEI